MAQLVRRPDPATEPIWVLLVEYPSSVTVFGPDTMENVQKFAGTMVSNGSKVSMTRAYPIGDDDD